MRSTRDEVRELREKLSEYEELLEKVLQGPFEEGEIQSEMIANMYRMADGSIKMVNLKNPNISSLKIGTKVLCNKDMVIAVLPDQLLAKPKPVEFNPIEWDEIGGLKDQISRIKEAVELPLTHGNLYRKYGLSPSRGIVLYGPPGCGKTMVAKAIASQYLKGSDITKDSFIYLKGGEMLSPYVGVAENNIKSIFERARENYNKKGSRSVIFIDEAEALLPARGSRRSSDVETTIVPTFLSEMDGFEDNNTLIILATNFVNQLDSAVIRPGRIDIKVEINRPSQNDLEDIFNLYFKKTLLKTPINELSKKAAEALYNKDNTKVSGAQVKNVVEKATLSAIKREISNKKSSGITLEDVINVINSL